MNLLYLFVNCRHSEWDLNLDNESEGKEDLVLVLPVDSIDSEQFFIISKTVLNLTLIAVSGVVNVSFAPVLVNEAQTKNPSVAWVHAFGSLHRPDWHLRVEVECLGVVMWHDGTLKYRRLLPVR